MIVGMEIVAFLDVGLRPPFILRGKPKRGWRDYVREDMGDTGLNAK